MQITEGIDVEYIDEAWCKAKILDEAGKHMPWIALSR